MSRSRIESGATQDQRVARLDAFLKEMTVVAHEMATLIGARQNKFRAKVLGFDPGIIRLLPSDPKYNRILPLSELDSMLSVGGHSIDSATLRGMFRERRIPFISELGILNLQDTLWIPCDDIDAIIPESSGNGELVGFLAGAAVDVGVIVFVTSHIKWHLFSGPFL